LIEQDFNFTRSGSQEETRSFRSVKFLCIAANFIVTAVIFIYFMSIGYQFQPILLSRVASITLCIVYSITAISFLFYGAALHQELGTMRKKSSRVDEGERCGIQLRIKLGALSVSLCFLVESFLFASSINSDTSKQDAILSFFDLWALITILALYFQGVNSKVGTGGVGSKSKSGGTKTEMSKLHSKVSKAESPSLNTKEIEMEAGYRLPSPSNATPLSHSTSQPTTETSPQKSFFPKGAQTKGDLANATPEEKSPLSSSLNTNNRPTMERETSMDVSMPDYNHSTNDTSQESLGSSHGTGEKERAESMHSSQQKRLTNLKEEGTNGEEDFTVV
jgi:hypothetical protein